MANNVCHLDYFSFGWINILFNSPDFYVRMKGLPEISGPFFLTSCG